VQHQSLRATWTWAMGAAVGKGGDGN
jgi:hypothetical protein